MPLASSPPPPLSSPLSPLPTLRAPLQCHVAINTHNVQVKHRGQGQWRAAVYMWEPSLGAESKPAPVLPLSSLLHYIVLTSLHRPYFTTSSLLHYIVITSLHRPYFTTSSLLHYIVITSLHRHYFTTSSLLRSAHVLTLAGCLLSLTHHM